MEDLGATLPAPPCTQHSPVFSELAELVPLCSWNSSPSGLEQAEPGHLPFPAPHSAGGLPRDRTQQSACNWVGGGPCLTAPPQRPPKSQGKRRVTRPSPHRHALRLRDRWHGSIQGAACPESQSTSPVTGKRSRQGLALDQNF